ncbi:SGNH/GDSL hydrolase family protein [Candidatus Tisiphia endosymbiont of Melanophora roralis]|uniref:SGNH/GDSL hydrolase family protein n=1 Tax=Candidatus Tisiphia endosymbiont of Melanophora roralis TaxID=3066261 RepID=UPI001E6A91F8|nr:MAG: hypothetical protein LF884_03150 [Rickettsia endosymbiont of Cimex lectularius]
MNKEAFMYKNFYVVGDSLSDNGAFVGSLNSILNVIKEEFHFLKWVDKIYFAPPFYQSRSFSNGPMAVEYVADKLGTTMKPGWSFNITPALKHWILEKKSIELGRPFDDLIKQGGIKATNYDFSEQIGTNYAVSNARASKGDAVPDFLLFNYFQLKNQVRTLVRHHPDISTEDLLFVMIGGNDIMAALFNKNPTALVDESITEICNAIEFLATNSSLQYIVFQILA